MSFAAQKLYGHTSYNDTGYPQDSRADKDSYPHDNCADKRFLSAWAPGRFAPKPVPPGTIPPGHFAQISNGTVRSKVVGRFAPKQIYGSIHPLS